jgi:capsular polysaccharide biosynthesis protein
MGKWTNIIKSIAKDLVIILLITIILLLFAFIVSR